MVVKLKSALINLNFRLLLIRLPVFAASLWWIRASEEKFLPTTALFISSYWLYTRAPALGLRIFGSFAVLIAFAFVVPVKDSLEIYILAGTTGLMYLLLGVRSLLFIKRENVYYFANIALSFGATVLYFLGYLHLILFALMLFILFRELYINMAPATSKKIIILVSLVDVLIVIQSSWIIAFLQLGPFTAALLTILFAFAFNDIMANHLRRTLTRKIIKGNIIVFGALSLLVLLGAPWRF